MFPQRADINTEPSQGGLPPNHGKYITRKIYYAKPHSTLDEPSAPFLGTSLLPGTRRHPEPASR